MLFFAYLAHKFHGSPCVVVRTMQVLGMDVEFLAYLGKSHLRAAAVLHELLVYELTVAETIVYAGEFVALTLICQVLDVVENAVPHDYLVGLFQHILYLLVELIEFWLRTKILFRIGKFYLRSALLAPEIEARGGIHDYVIFF